MRDKITVCAQLSIMVVQLERGVGLKTGTSTTSMGPAYVLGSAEVIVVTDTTTAAYQSEDISSAGLTKGKPECTLHSSSSPSSLSPATLIIVYTLPKDTLTAIAEG